MKKILILSVVVLAFLTGCTTTSMNHRANTKGYKPQVNMFEKKLWISIPGVELFQDEASVYLHITYDSKRAGKYSIFNPPSGNAFKLLGDLSSGTGEILQQINKDSLSGIEGMTALFFPGDYSNESDRAGFFIKLEEIPWRQIPQIPNDIIVTEPDSEVTVEVEPPKEKAITPDNSFFPDSILSNFQDFTLEDRTYKWGGKIWKREFIYRPSVSKIQTFIDSIDSSKGISLETILAQLGEPLYYAWMSDIHYERSALPQQYIMVYAAMWSDELSESLSIEVDDGVPLFIETKYSGWFDIDGFSIGQEYSDFKNNLDARGLLTRDESIALQKENGEDSLHGYIVDSGRFSSYSNTDKSYELSWESNGAMTAIWKRLR